MVKGRRSKRRRCPAASLTDDLIVEILSRLPARSVCRFRCVSTAWRDLIYANHRKLPQTLAGFFTMHDGEGSMSSVPHFTNVSGRDGPLVPSSFEFLPNRVYLQHSCNGLVLCSYWPNPPDDDLYCFVCNPATKKWMKLPGFLFGGRCCWGLSLGFDPIASPHFYVFQLFEDRDNLVAGVQVYSSETGQTVGEETEWDNRIIGHCAPFSLSVFLNGCQHYLTYDPAIAVVDTRGKLRRSIPVPDNKDDGFIHQSQGRLHYANFEADDEDQVVRLVVYVLEDYDNQQWTLKHSAEAEYVLRRTSSNLFRDFELVAIHPDCNIIFYTVGWDKTLMSYDMDRRRVQVICILGQDTRELYLPYVPWFSELQALHA